MLSRLIAIDRGYDFLVTGDSWGQVASQTPSNLKTCRILNEIPIIAPLLGFNKDEIIKIAKNIGTFKVSICDGTSDCCTMYLPKHPVLKSDIGKTKTYIDMMPTIDIAYIESLLIDI